MSLAETHTSYPRALRQKEMDLLESVLPPDRPGYRRYRDLVNSMVVIGEGRRGAGNLVLGPEGHVPDLVSPLAQVVAYGVVETTLDSFTMTVREYIGNQIDVEIVSSSLGEIPDHFEEKRRWTYSTWRPGSPSPLHNQPVREVVIGEAFVLVISRDEKRLWVYDGDSGMNLLIPITNFYNELMLHKHIRDPRVALVSQLLFTHLEEYSDDDLRVSFITYNILKRKVDVKIHTQTQEGKLSRGFLTKWVRKAR